MVVSQVLKSQSQVELTSRTKSLTVFSPPGLFIETAKYPILTAGVLATLEDSEWLSIFDHPDAWRGLERDTIFRMREQLLRFVLPVESRTLEPKRTVEVLQTLALSVSPIALDVQVNDMPSSKVHPVGGLLPCGPMVNASAIEIVSEPEISKVAQRVTEKDVPTSESVWSLLDFDYTVDQIARLVSVGLLGYFEHRRLLPLRSAYKATIDTTISRCIMELADRPRADASKIFMATLFGDSFTVLSIPGEPRVDYLRMERKNGGFSCTSSLEDLRCPSNETTTAVHADHARFSAYIRMVADKLASHNIIFHFTRNARSNSLGPWISRAGVNEALLSTPVLMEEKGNALAVLSSVLRPELGRWASNNPLLDLLGFEEVAHPLVNTTI